MKEIENRDFSPIIFVGMHRSGTTMLSQFLDQIGVFMGVRKEQNSESIFFQKLNKWVIRQFNAGWDNPENIFHTNQFVRNQILRVLDQHLSGFRRIEYLGVKNFFKYPSIKDLDFHWGWKDPRTTLLLDYWLELFPTAKVLHISRHPIDVASSLGAREQGIRSKFKNRSVNSLKEFLLLDVEYQPSPRMENIIEAIDLWTTYSNKLTSSISNLDRSRIFEIRYEDFLESPKRHLLDLCEFLLIDKSENVIDNFVGRINKKRAYAYKKDDKLVKYESYLQQNKTAIRLGYA